MCFINHALYTVCQVRPNYLQPPESVIIGTCIIIIGGFSHQLGVVIMLRVTHSEASLIRPPVGSPASVLICEVV